MYINRIILREAKIFDTLDIMLQNEWTDKPLQSVLLTGSNGSGKTTLLRLIAGLWQNFSNWLRLRKGLNASQQSQNNLLIEVGLVAIEIHDFQSFPIWLFMASSPEYWEELRDTVKSEDAQFIGEIRGTRGRPQFIMNDTGWFNKLSEQKDRLQVGVDDAASLPNLIYLEAETRTIITPNKRYKPDVYTESLYQWYVTYEARDQWEKHIESMLRNLKLRSPALFRQSVERISQFWEDDKKITDFDDNLRLLVQIGRKKRNSHYIEDLSAGERQCLILMFMVTRWLMEGGIVLIDEPDLHLHVSLQRQLIHELEKIVEQKSGQLIVTSHSPTMWEEFNERQRFELGQLQYG